MTVAVEQIATDQPPDEAKARDVDYGWQSGNQVELLENGEAYFPQVFEALRGAQREILLETFILFEDKVGHELKGILIEAAQALPPASSTVPMKRQAQPLAAPAKRLAPS